MGIIPPIQEHHNVSVVVVTTYYRTAEILAMKAKFLVIEKHTKISMVFLMVMIERSGVIKTRKEEEQNQTTRSLLLAQVCLLLEMSGCASVIEKPVDNKTHMSGFHVAWSKNKKGFRLPSTHEFMVRMGNRVYTNRWRRIMEKSGDYNFRHLVTKSGYLDRSRLGLSAGKKIFLKFYIFKKVICIIKILAKSAPPRN